MSDIQNTELMRFRNDACRALELTGEGDDFPAVDMIIGQTHEDDRRGQRFYLEQDRDIGCWAVIRVRGEEVRMSVIELPALHAWLDNLLKEKRNG